MQFDKVIDKPVPITTHHLQGEPRDGRKLYPMFSPDGEWLICVMWMGSLWAWQTRDRQKIDLPIAGESWEVAFSSTGKRLAVERDQCTTVLEWPSCREVARFTWPSLECYFKFVGDDHLLLFSDDQLKLWNIVTGAELMDWSTWKTGAFDVRLWRGQPVALTISDVTEGEYERNNCLSAINLRTKERTLLCGPVDQPPGHGTFSHRELQFTRDLGRVLVCTDYHPASYELWDMENALLCGRVTKADFGGVDPLLSADGRYLVGETPFADGLMVWDTLHDQLAGRIELDHRYAPHAISSTHQVVAAIANRVEDQIDRTLFVDFSTGACLGETSGHVLGGLGSKSFSLCGRWFGSAVPRS